MDRYGYIWTSEEGVKLFGDYVEKARETCDYFRLVDR